MTENYGSGAKRDVDDIERAMSMDGFFADDQTIDQTIENPPSPHDDYETRAAWAREVVAQIATSAPQSRSARVALPDDIRPSHFWEVEYQSALVDPIAYARSIQESARARN